MKKAIIAALILVTATASMTSAVEWKQRLGIGIRGPLFAPMIKGSNYSGVTTVEPYMMGLGGNLDIKYGITNSFVIAVSGGYWFTYDDTLATVDQSFKLNNKDNASRKLTMIPISLTGQWYFVPTSNVQPYLLGGLSMDLSKYEDLIVNVGTKYSSTDLTAKVGAGINFWIGESFTFDLSGRFSYLLNNMSSDATLNYEETDTRPFLGVLEPAIGLTFFVTGAKDTDGDGIKDKYDQCPDTPRGALVDEYGCPLDTDGDGVFDGIDACEDTPKGAIVDISGCPLDTDMDKVPDGLDMCPDTPLGVLVDDYGCPLDEDKDGVPDFLDQQLNTPAGALVDSVGIALDTDGDGVADGIDKCPETGEGVVVDEFGCPTAKPLTEKIVLNIQYAPGSVEPDEEAKVILDDIAMRMKIYTNAKIEVNGYTDALGSSRSNLKLSQKRAEAVKKYLVEKGIDPDRMKPKGFGEDKKYFIATNETPEGRQKNRRVEIVPIQ